MNNLLLLKGQQRTRRAATLGLLFLFVCILTPHPLLSAQESVETQSPTSGQSPVGGIFNNETPSDTLSSSDLSSSDTQMQESIVLETTPSIGEAVSPDSASPSSEDTSTNKPPEEILLEEDASMSAGLSVTGPASGNLVSASGQSGPGIDNRTGRFSYEFPLIFPAGRGSMHPGLSLIYDSQEDESSNQAGYGWIVNIPYIVRLNTNGTDKLYASSTFASSFDGELATTSTSGMYGAKVESGDFLKYELSGPEFAL